MSVTPSAVSTWISGRTNPGPQTLNHLQRVLEKECPKILEEIAHEDTGAHVMRDDTVPYIVNGGGDIENRLEKLPPEQRKILEDLKSHHRRIERDVARSLVNSASLAQVSPEELLPAETKDALKNIVPKPEAGVSSGQTSTPKPDGRKRRGRRQ